MGIAIELVAAPTAEAKELLAELDAELSAHYPREQRHGLALDQLFHPGIRFFVAQLSGAAIGCGGVALFADYAEVKRMYVREAARGRGVGKALLAHIAAAARAEGQRLLRLETGTAQTAAISLYERCGFRRCGPFGPYAELVPQRIAASLFYERAL